MNAINWKKLLLPNIPYLFFVYLFDKVGQAVRLAPGADLSGKVLSLGEGFSTAFANPLPSLAPMDLLIGIVGAALIWLMVYFKGKNAKKYRKGVEYGSARWGNAEDIKPYTDPVFQNNVLLTQTERLTMNSRPKQPKYARNKNILVIGGSGSGKTRFFVKPNLMQLMTEDEIAVMDGGKCILQLRGVRPFFSDKYDITKHPNYKYLSDYDKKNTFDMEKHLRRRPALVKPDEPFDYYEISEADLQEDTDHE